VLRHLSPTCLSNFATGLSHETRRTFTKKFNFHQISVEFVEFFSAVTQHFAVVELPNRKNESGVTPPVDLNIMLQYVITPYCDGEY
jgi:hypothetical protein